MPTAYIIQYTGQPDERTQALLAWLSARGYTNQQTEILTRITVALPVRPMLMAGDEGIDVSRHNWPIDWPAVAGAGRRFTYIRASMGTTGRDDRFDSHWSGARAAGLLVGAYHYHIWNLDGLQQAENFHAAISGDYGELPPVVDVEPRDIDTPAAVDRARSTAELVSYINRLQQLSGKAPVIYTSRTAWARMTTEPEWLRNYLLFVADYGGPVELPAHAAFAWMHHYRVAEAGELAWHPGKLDLDRYTGDDPPGPPEPQPGPLYRVRVIAASLNVRAGPGVTHAALGTVTRDMELDVWEVGVNNWQRISQAEQRWISGAAAYTVRI